MTEDLSGLLANASSPTERKTCGLPSVGTGGFSAGGDIGLPPQPLESANWSGRKIWDPAFSHLVEEYGDDIEGTCVRGSVCPEDLFVPVRQ